MFLSGASEGTACWLGANASQSGAALDWSHDGCSPPKPSLRLRCFISRLGTCFSLSLAGSSAYSHPPPAHYYFTPTLPALSTPSQSQSQIPKSQSPKSQSSSLPPSATCVHHPPERGEPDRSPDRQKFYFDPDRRKQQHSFPPTTVRRHWTPVGAATLMALP